MKSKEISKGRFLVWKDWWSCTKVLIEISIVEVSETSVKFKFISGYTEWLTKKDFDDTFKIHERL